MGRILASLVVAASLLSVASSEASAWVCRAAGLGSGGCAASMRALQSAADLHDPVVSSRWLNLDS